MYSRDHPDELKFERSTTKAERMQVMSSRVAWSDVLSGRSLNAFMGQFIPKWLGNQSAQSGGSSPSGMVKAEFSGPMAAAMTKDLRNAAN